MTSEPSKPAEAPWLAIAIAMLAIGGVVIAALSLGEPPPPPIPPVLVQRAEVDLGSWVPFVDVGVDAGVALDAAPHTGDE